jgi:hypothetical protein
VRVRPISFENLIDEIAAALLVHDGRTRVAVDGAEALDPGAYAEAIAHALHEHGRAALHVRTDDFLLPASQRYEYGKTSDESFYLAWRDVRGLRREVLDPAAGTGRVLPALWRSDIDRSARAAYVDLPDRAIVLVSGQFLLGSGLPFEHTIRLECSPAALARRTPPERAWTLPAYQRYDDEVAPASFADVVVRLEDPRRPAVLDHR